MQIGAAPLRKASPFRKKTFSTLHHSDNFTFLNADHFPSPYLLCREDMGTVWTRGTIPSNSRPTAPLRLRNSRPRTRPHRNRTLMTLTTFSTVTTIRPFTLSVYRSIIKSPSPPLPAVRATVLTKCLRTHIKPEMWVMKVLEAS